MADLLHQASDQLVAIAPEHPAQGRVDVDEATLQRHDRHADAGRGHGQPEARVVLVGGLVRGHRRGRLR